MIKSVLILLAAFGMPLWAAAQENKTSETKDAGGAAQLEQMPQFPGGEQELKKFIDQNLRYPEKARNEDIQGKVWLSFVIEKDGSISTIKVVRDIGGGCAEEAVRLLKAMPKWIPGKRDGVLVKVMYNLPFTFKLMD